ncbi:MAG: hypothetical protein ACI9D4_002168 [Polaribacter sp.]|jgi:hypothetical protein
MKTNTLIVLFWMLPFCLFSQTETGNLEDYIATKISNAPGSSGDNYVIPTSTDLTSWNTIIDAVLANNIASARTNAASLNYQVTEFTDTSLSPNQLFYVLEEKSSQTNYWGTYVFSQTPIRNNLIIQAPHSKYDTNTGKEAMHCFKNLVAKALFINGTHRCNNSDSSSCSGTTSACGSSEAFRVSDVAHTTVSVFQKTTENVFNTVTNSVFIQLHGFGKQSTDPYVIISNGSRVTPTTDYAVQLKDALFAVDANLTFKLAHIDTDWTRLIAFTNTQGRLINNSDDYCNTSAITTSGRFIHVEQERSKLRADVSGWAKMKTALSNVFSSTLDIDTYELEKEISISPNPTSGVIKVKGENIKSIEVLNQLGQTVQLIEHPEKSNTVFVNLKKLATGIYFFKIKTSKGILKKKIIKN